MPGPPTSTKPKAQRSLPTIDDEDDEETYPRPKIYPKKNLKGPSAKHILTFIYFQRFYDIWCYFTIFGTTLRYLVLLDYISVFITYFFGYVESVSKCEKANENVKKRKKVPCHKESLRRK